MLTALSIAGFIRSRTIMANAIVASILPDGVVKGGSALKMRFGNEASRFTVDLDTATAMDSERYAEQSAGLPVLSNVDEAVEWANAFIREIDGVHEGAAE